MNEEHKIKIRIKESDTHSPTAVKRKKIESAAHVPSVQKSKTEESSALVTSIEKVSDTKSGHIKESAAQTKTVDTKKSVPLAKPVAKKKPLALIQRAKKLFHRGYSRIKEAKTKKRGDKEVQAQTPTPWFAGFSIKELTHFSKRLAFLIRSGVPILESLQLLRKQTRSRTRGKILDSIVEDVANGRFLSAGLGRFRKIFGNFTINIVRVGEMSGTLSQNLTYLSHELEKRNALKRKLISALVYPAFITVATIGISTMLVVYIFPKVMPIFISLNVTLPFTTKALLFFSEILRNWGLYILGGLIVASIAYVLVRRKSEQFHYLVSRTVLRVPLFGTLVQNYNMANFCRTLSLLLQSGFNVVEATTVTADSTENPVYKRQCFELRESIIKGERVSTCLEKSPKIFPDTVCHMITIGETSGTLSETLMYLAEHYEAEVDDTIKNLSSSIEPVLMIFMGVIVGFIAVSIITPIYAVTQHLSR